MTELIVAEERPPGARSPIHFDIPWVGNGYLNGAQHFDGWSAPITKSFGNPDRLCGSLVYSFRRPGGNVCILSPFFMEKETDHWQHDNEYTAGVNDGNWKYNHYPLLSYADIRRKATEERDPFLARYTPQVDEYFSKVTDTDINRFVADVKRNMLARIREAQPLHPDDWEPESILSNP